jgi:hypothetical protein
VQNAMPKVMYKHTLFPVIGKLITVALQIMLQSETFEWHHRFKDYGELEDDPHSKRSAILVNEQNVKKLVCYELSQVVWTSMFQLVVDTPSSVKI